MRCCGAEPSFFLEVSYRFVESAGLTFLCDWFEAAYDAWLRDSGRADGSAPSSPTSSAASPAPIPPELTDELLHHLLLAWFRVSTYQQERCRAALPPRPRVFARLRALIDHPNADIADLAVGLLLLYQPDSAAEVHDLVQRSPTTAVAEGSQPVIGGPTSVTAKIRAEYELARAASEAQETLTQAEAPVTAAESTNGAEHSAATPSPSLVEGTKTESTVNSPSSSARPSSSPAPVSTSAPATAPASPPSPNSAMMFSAAFASLSCPVCGECFTTDLNTYHHVATQHQLALCILCALAFPSEELLYAHFEGHNHAAEQADAPHACGLCGVSFHTEDGLTLHHQVHVIERKAKQQYTKKKNKRKLAAASSTEERGSPSKRVKKDEEEDEAADADGGDDDGGGGPNRFPPAICSHPSHPSPLCFTSDEDLQSHASAAHVTWQCFANDCDSFFGSQHALDEHIVKAHVLTSRDYQAGSAVPPHCSFCGVIWTKKTPRTEHLHRHEKPFHCLCCAMRFARRTRWRNHVKRKHPEDFKRHSAIFEGTKG